MDDILIFDVSMAGAPEIEGGLAPGIHALADSAK